MIIEGDKNEPSGTSGANAVPEEAQLQKPGSKEDVLMDYERLAKTEGDPPHGIPQPPIGLIGGQSKNDEGGLDISQYTGPQSKNSNQLDDPKAQYGTGPGNGLSGNTKAGETE